MERIERAGKAMQDGDNCGMSILAAFGEEYGLDPQAARRLGRPLGGGMGLLGQTCGAVSAGFLVLGLAADQTQEEGKLRPQLYRQVRELARLFEERNQTIVCRDLLGLDLDTEEGAARFKAEDMFETRCCKFVRDTAEILAEMI